MSLLGVPSPLLERGSFLLACSLASPEEEEEEAFSVVRTRTSRKIGYLNGGCKRHKQLAATSPSPSALSLSLSLSQPLLLQLWLHSTLLLLLLLLPPFAFASESEIR